MEYSQKIQLKYSNDLSAEFLLQLIMLVSMTTIKEELAKLNSIKEFLETCTEKVYIFLQNIVQISEIVNEHNGHDEPSIDRKMYSNGYKSKAIENLYTKSSKILRTEISKNISNLQTITTDDISLVSAEHLQQLRKTISNLDLKTDLNEQFLLINDPNCHIIYSRNCFLCMVYAMIIVYHFYLHYFQTKKKTTYVNLFKNIINLSNAREFYLKPNLFISDFEKAIHVALRQEFGLSYVYQNNKTVESKWLKHTFGLPFISQNEVSDCFIEDFMSFIPNDIRFQKYATNIASLALTTNACESYQSGINSKFYHKHPTIYHFLDVVHLKKRNSTKNKNQLENFQQIYEDYRQYKIEKKENYEIKLDRGN
ncbi:hypothetical protein QTP88_019525 [Uroleucon formosanum]